MNTRVYDMSGVGECVLGTKREDVQITLHHRPGVCGLWTIKSQNPTGFTFSTDFSADLKSFIASRYAEPDRFFAIMHTLEQNFKVLREMQRADVKQALLRQPEALDEPATEIRPKPKVVSVKIEYHAEREKNRFFVTSTLSSGGVWVSAVGDVISELRVTGLDAEPASDWLISALAGLTAMKEGVGSVSLEMRQKPHQPIAVHVVMEKKRGLKLFCVSDSRNRHSPPDLTVQQTYDYLASNYEIHQGQAAGVIKGMLDTSGTFYCKKSMSLVPRVKPLQKQQDVTVNACCEINLGSTPTTKPLPDDDRYP